MDAILIKVFATALALSQVITRPDEVKTQFDPAQDQAAVVQMLNAGCAHMRKAFDIENIDLDDLIDTAMTDTRTGADEVKGFRGLKFGDLHIAYRQICKSEKVEQPVVDLAKVIEFYNAAAVDLPDHTRLKDLKLPGLTTVLDIKGAPYAELFEPEHRRLWVPLAEIPLTVRQAFIAAEDKRFYNHGGVDERSVIRAFVSMLGDPGRRQGGSTITQQVAKNLLVGDDISYERKIREIIVASRVEKALTKDEILEVYLNAIYLGRSAWGIELAARGYFGKSVKDLTLVEAAFLAGLAKGPNYYNPDRHRARAQTRLSYVLERMQENGAIDEAQFKQARAERLAIAERVRPRRDSGYHIVDQIRREAKTMAGIGSLTSSSYLVRSTINPQLQWAAEAALQDGLARYEQSSGRARFRAAEANLADAIQKLQAAPNAEPAKPAWQQALVAVRLPLYDVHWAPAVVLEKVLLKGGVESIRVGLRDGRVLPLSTHGSETRRLLKINDVIYVRVFESRPAPNTRQQTGTRVELRSRPEVQAAAVVLENRTGRVLAMVGGFSFPLSQLNRATQSRRQPGSSFKPVVYLAALGSGLQPNTMISDGPITLPPIGYNPNSRSYSYDPKDWWSPKNYDSGSSGSMTLRRGLEQSKNLVTAHLLEGGIAASPAESLDRVCQVAKDAQLYEKCERYYPFVLGAQPVRPVDLAAFYATIPNEGLRPTPHIIEAIEQSGKTIYRQSHRLTSIGAVDRAAAFQLRSILQGVLARGTARSIGAHAPYVGGKTGTSDEENDAWFVGFSNEVTIAVWVGYDNARGKRTLGTGQTGGKIAVPIFEPIMQAAWQFHAPKTVLRGPSPEASRMLVAMPIDLYSGARIGSRRRQDERLYGDRDFGEQPYSEQNPGSRAFTEYFRLDANGRMVDTQHRMISRSHVSHSHTYDVGNANPWNDRSAFDDNPFSRLFGFPSQQQPPPDPRYRGNAPPGYVGPRGLPQPAPRPDPNYQWGRQQQHRIY